MFVSLVLAAATHIMMFATKKDLPTAMCIPYLDPQAAVTATVLPTLCSVFKSHL